MRRQNRGLTTVVAGLIAVLTLMSTCSLAQDSKPANEPTTSPVIQSAPATNVNQSTPETPEKPKLEETNSTIGGSQPPTPNLSQTVNKDDQSQSQTQPQTQVNGTKAESSNVTKAAENSTTAEKPGASNSTKPNNSSSSSDNSGAVPPPSQTVNGSSDVSGAVPSSSQTVNGSSDVSGAVPSSSQTVNGSSSSNISGAVPPPSQTVNISSDASGSENSICSKCHCPSDKTTQPYVIDCRNSELEEIDIHLNDATMGDVNEIYIDFSFNKATYVPKMERNDKIVGLNLANNKISSVTPNAFNLLPKLKQLSLANNNLTTIHHSAFCGSNDFPSSLVTLDISGNRINHFDDDLFQCVNDLAELYMGSNDIKQFDGSTISALNSLRSLKTLDVSNNQLNELRSVLTNPITQLETLSLARNNFDTVPEILHDAKSLRNLNLNNNLFKVLDPKSFAGMNSLVSLNVSEMPSLRKIELGTFPQMNLSYFNCSHNPSLELIYANLFNNETSPEKHMEMVDLSYNNLSLIIQEIFRQVHVHSLDIRGNPIHCTCHIIWVLIEGQVEVDEVVKQELTCSSPKNLAGKKLVEIDFHSKDFECYETVIGVQQEASPSYVFLLTVIIIVAFLLVGVLVYLIKSQRIKRYKSLGAAGSVHYSKYHDNSGFESINCDEIEEYSRYPTDRK